MRIDAILFGEVKIKNPITTMTNDDEQMANNIEIVIPFNYFLRSGVRSSDEIKQTEVLNNLSRQLVSALKESVGSVSLSEVKITYDGPQNLFTITATFVNNSVTEFVSTQREIIIQRVCELDGTEYNLGCSEDDSSSTHKFIFHLAEIQCSPPLPPSQV